MTENDKEFWDLAEAFIQLANKSCSKVDADKVNDALLYATGRFNAFTVAAQTETPEELEFTREGAIEYFVAQYKMHFEENFDDYLEHYADYTS